jgi:hypothetical protein
MCKCFAILAAGVLLCGLTGCDPGSNDFSKRSQQTETPMVALLSSNDVEVL